MPKKRPPNPDDFMVVYISLELMVQLNPEIENPIPFETTGFDYTLPAIDAIEYLEEIIQAIDERRLYGFMVQEHAAGAVDSGSWIKKSTRNL
jgi:hypothetical protein